MNREIHSQQNRKLQAKHFPVFVEHERQTIETSRQRITRVLNHQSTSSLPVDFGGSLVSGIHVDTIYQIRQQLGLDPPGTPVKVIEPFQMLGEIDSDLREIICTDCVSLTGPTNAFGFSNTGCKEWVTFGGSPVLVPDLFHTFPEADGSIVQYPQGDRNAPASGRMPHNGFYFDSIIRQEPIVDAELNVNDNTEEFTVLSNEDLEYFRQETDRLWETGCAIFAGFPNLSFGDIAAVPAPFLKHPKGIRDVTEWYISTISRRDYIMAVFERQSEVTLENLRLLFETLGNQPTLVMVSATDFGTQNGTFLSPESYRELYMPFHKKLNDWIHKNTEWKSFIHSCGAIMPLMDLLIEAGFDVFNPVQCSATGMDPKVLKERYGDHICFWGGGVDTQKTLPFGTPDEVRDEVRRRIDIFGKQGGFVFNSIHNIQAKTPVDNLLAMFEVLKEYR